MDALAQKKISEAKQHVADAEKSMKTSLFKRKPDLESASSSYEKAGSCYKIAKDHKNAIECFQKSADCFVQNNSLFSAAKQLEQAGLLANEIKNYALLYDSFQKAAEFMITSGTRDSAGILLERGANMMKLTDPEKALKLYKRAIQISEVEEKYHEMVTFYESMVALALRINQYNEAIEIINEAFKIIDRIGQSEQIVKYILTVILIYLSRDDWVSGKNYLETMKQKYDVASDGKGLSRADELLEAYDEKEDTKFKDIIRTYLSYAVDNEALKIAQNIVKSDEWRKAVEENKPKPNVPQEKPSYSSSYSSSTQAVSPATVSKPAAESSAAAAASYDRDDSNLNENESHSNQNQADKKDQNDDEDDEFADGLL